MRKKKINKREQIARKLLEKLFNNKLIIDLLKEELKEEIKRYPINTFICIYRKELLFQDIIYYMFKINRKRNFYNIAEKLSIKQQKYDKKR